MRSTQKTRALAAFAAAALALGAVGCGSDGESGSEEPASGSASTTKTEPAKQIRLGYLITATQSTWGTSSVEAATKAAEAAGATLEVFSAEYDAQKQLQQCENAVTTGKFDGFLIYPVDNAAAIPCVKAVEDAGLKLVTNDGQIGTEFEAEAPQMPGISAQIGYLSPKIFGVGWAELAAKACGDKAPCEVGLMTGPPEYTLTVLERDAFDEALKKYPNIKLVQSLVAGYSDPDSGMKATQNLLQRHPGVDVIVDDDDHTTAGIAKAIAEAGKTKEIALIGSGATTEAVERIKNGTQFGSLWFGPRSSAKLATEMLIKAVKKEPIEDNSVPFSEQSPLSDGGYLVTKDNVAEITPEW
jgi:ribose transport system substrate-binding protein